jgi:hypothetical protein
MERFTVLLTGLLLALGMLAMPAAADHDHGLQVGNGDCVVLAGAGGEKDVSLPDAAILNNPHANDQWAGNETRNHPLHVFVHTGKPGQHLELGVLGGADDPCATSGEYRNRR